MFGYQVQDVSGEKNSRSRWASCSLKPIFRLIGGCLVNPCCLEFDSRSQIVITSWLVTLTCGARFDSSFNHVLDETHLITGNCCCSCLFHGPNLMSTNPFRQIKFQQQQESAQSVVLPAQSRAADDSGSQVQKDDLYLNTNGTLS